MKIGLVLPYNIARSGGVASHVLDQQDELVKRGHEVVILTPQPREPYDAAGRAVSFIGTQADFRSPLDTTIQVSASMLTDDIDTLLEYHQFDILHFHEPWVPVLSRQILSRSQSINVATFHAKLPETFMSQTVGRVFTPYTRPLLRHIQAFTAVSDAAAEYLLSLADVNVEIIPNGIHLRHFKRTANSAVRPSDQPKTILYVGRLEGRKGVKYLLLAFQQLQAQNPDVRLLLAGDGSDREKLQDQVQKLGLNNVEFLGFISEEKKLELLHTCDLFCSPAIYGESFGIVLLEAMASDLVTVAGNNAGYEAVMQGLGKLSLVDPKDSNEFAHRLQLLLYDEDLRKLWRKWAKDYVKQFEFSKIVDRYEALYETVLQTSIDQD